MATKTRERNYRTNPHTARFLLRFHSAAQGHPAELTDDNAAERELAETEDLLDSIPVEHVADHRSPRQVQIMESLVREITERDVEAGSQAQAYTEGMTRAGKWTAGRDGNASAWITRMIDKARELRLSAARKPEVAQPGQVRQGRYAVEHQGVLKFFHVGHGKAGTRWEGFTFLDVRASDETYAIRNRATKTEILALIAADPETAMNRYGQELGECGDCGRTLTDAESRRIGRGPICRNK